MKIISILLSLVLFAGNANATSAALINRAKLNNFRVSSGVVAPPSNTYLGQVATGCRMSNGGNSSNHQSMSITRHIARAAITNDMQIGYPNWWVNTSFVEQGPGGTTTLTASIEYPIGVTITQVRWSGSTSVTVADGVEAPLSDAIGVTIPAGDAFYVRTYANAVSSMIFQIISSGSGQILDTTNGEAYRTAASGLADQTLVLGPISGGSSVTTRRFGPIVILSNITAPSVYLLGDSRTVGINDTFTGTSGDLGDLQRSIGPYFGYTSMAISGQYLQAFIASHTQQLALAQYFSHVIVELGINDLGAHARTAAQIANDYTTVAGYFSSTTKFITTLAPESTSTDSFATLANQTPRSTEAVRVQVNTATLAGRTGYTGGGVFDLNSIAEATPIPTGKWIVDGSPNTYTSDGVHESQVLNLLYVSSNIVDHTRITR